MGADASRENVSTLKMKSTYLAAAAAFTIYFVLLYFVLTSPDRPATPFQQTYVNGPVNITGYLTQKPFPARQYVSEEAANGKPLYSLGEYMAVAGNETSTPFYLFNQKYKGTIWENYGLWPPSFELDLGGLSNWDVYGAYTSQLRVTIIGNAFTVDRLNGTFQCVEVDRIVIHNRLFLPFFVEWWRINGGTLINHGVVGTSTNFDTNHFLVSSSEYLNSTSYYRVALGEGDSVRFTAESDQPFSLKVYASVGGKPSENGRVLGSVIYSFENVTSVSREFTVFEAGTYSYSFYTDYRLSGWFMVDFEAGRFGKAVLH